MAFESILLAPRCLGLGIADLGDGGDDPGTLARGFGALADEIAGESRFELGLALEEGNLLWGQLDGQGLDVVVQVLDLAAADDGEHVGRLLHHVGERDRRQALEAVLARDLFQRRADLLLAGRLVARAKGAAQALALLLARLDLLLGLELAPANHVPGRERHAKVARHRDDVALKVAQHDVPPPLVHAERRLAVRAGIGVGRADEPRWRVRDAQVQHFALLDQDVQTVHDFFDRRRVILAFEFRFVQHNQTADSPGRGFIDLTYQPVHVQEVDVVGLELLQRVSHREMETFPRVARIVDRLALTELP